MGGPEELITAEDAAGLLGVSVERLLEYAALGELRAVTVKGPEGLEVMYYRGEVLQLKGRLGRRSGEVGAEEWPELIGG